MAILVKNLPSQATQADLIELFNQYGNVRHISISPKIDHITVEIEGEANEERAIQGLNGEEWLGQKLELFQSEQDQAPKGEPNNSRRLIIGQMPYQELIKESQRRIHRLDELDPKTDEEVQEQLKALKYIEEEFKNK
ncbi:RNA recognition motif domain-containing protein [Iningainema tapete]|uniref:RNA-binding protein n=1 Tax=Iningainema tapete BLCC-T55 TaxID=2748662 RepID=A0A8J6XUI9_9CYAN|nr:RNA-binding protein [Iningainema tapete]MBD2778555.1 RNA-binding protein [Iningainema tapete BLCC-T55]